MFAIAARSLEVSYHPAGPGWCEPAAKPLGHLYVIRKGSVRLEREGQVLQVLEEGETFGYTSLITRKATLDVAVEEDLLAYRLPAREFQLLLADARSPATSRSGSRSGSRPAWSTRRSPPSRPTSPSRSAQLLRRPAVWVDAPTHGGATRPGPCASREHLVGAGPGRPARHRHRPRPPQPRAGRRARAGDPGRRHLLPPAAHRRGDHAGLRGLDHAARHRRPPPPHRRGEGDRRRPHLDRPAQAHRPGAGGGAPPGRAAGRARALAGYAGEGDRDGGRAARRRARCERDRRLRGAAQRHAAPADPPLGRGRPGPAPAPYAWVVFGSEGRMEQTLLTDQDNALVYADAGAARRPGSRPRRSGGGRPRDGGLPALPGGHMASRCHGVLSGWVRNSRLHRRAPAARRGALLRLPARGRRARPADLSAIVARAPRSPLLLRFLARQALEFSPPGSLVLRLRGILHRGSQVAGDLPGGLPGALLRAGGGRNQPEHPRPARGRSPCRADGPGGVELRDRGLPVPPRAPAPGAAAGHPCRRAPATNKVALGDLSGIERSRLKDSFRAIKSWQEKAAYHYQVDFS